MLAARLWNNLMGYVIIKVEGLSLEKFINLMVSKGIYIWDIDRINYTTLIAKISIKGFKKLPSVVARVKCRVTILKKAGYPFLIYRLKHRKMLGVGVFIAFLIVYLLSSFIWTVEISGLERIEQEEVLYHLEQLGLKKGAWKRSIKIGDIESKMIINVSDISWIGIEIKGIKAIVEVVEIVKPPEILDKNIPCDIIAKKDGIIENIYSLEGQEVVEKGDTVKKGQVLITGIISRDDQVLRYVHSIGEVKARTWYEGRAHVSLNQQRTVRTGDFLEKKYIRLGSKTIYLKNPDISFSKFEKEEKISNVFDLKQFFQFQVVTEHYYEVVDEKRTLSVEEAKKEAEKLALKQAQAFMPDGVEIVDKNTSYSMINGEKLEAVVTVEVIEDIGETRVIDTYEEEMNIDQPDV